MGVEEDYLWVTGNAFSEMRLLIEGAIVLYESDAGDLCGLTIKADMPKARYALNDIGTALYELRRTLKPWRMSTVWKTCGSANRGSKNKHLLSLTENHERKQAGIGSKMG